MSVNDHWRRRVVATVAPAAAALVLMAAVLPEGPSASEVPRVAGASETRCLPTGGLDTVAELDAFAREVRGNPEFQGGDVGASVELQDGRQLFVFGDTLRGASFDGQGFVHNSMLVFSPACAQAVLPADHGAIVPDRRDGVGYWPMSVAKVEHPGYDLVGVSTQRVRDTGDPGDGGSGVFAFEQLGPAVAIFVVPRGGTPQLIDQQDLGPDLVDTTRPVWGAATAVVGDQVYLYGTARPDTTGVFGFSLQVARVDLDDLLDPTAWRYWDGERWQRDADRVAELVPAVGGVSQTLSVFEQDGHWYAVSKRDEVLGSDLTIWTAPAPTGPFTPSPALAQIPSDAATGTLRYLPLAHPDLLPRPGTVVISYSQNDTDVGDVLADPRLYRPRFLRVRLPDPTD
ncbi:DUF4185 domain-containing protein [Nocardioides rubriscoriae]|uniref:DUF4185 domain-containing protein n=1 Tax=Nocardioides rubriscoriae TaxID=642762 RepID=UPI0011DFF11A|nr:DUF4185 domain-containing protein [Nocardioides rubriscoriae]